MEEKVSEMTMEDTKPNLSSSVAGEIEDDEDEEEAADMEAFEVSGMLDEQDKVGQINIFILK